MLLHLDGRGARYRQIYRSLKRMILAGELGEDARLPASRVLAQSLGVSRNVVLLAYDQLKSEGYISGRVGDATRVCALPESGLESLQERVTMTPEQLPERRLSEQAGIALQQWRRRCSGQREQHLKYDFRYGEVSIDQRTVTLWKRLNSRLFDRSLLQYEDPRGDPELRELIAGHARSGRGCHCDADQVCIVNGSQQALDLVARLLIRPETRVYLEEPGYLGSRACFETAGAGLHPLPVDVEGVDTSCLPEHVAQPALLYVTPSHQFPTGAILSLSRRVALLEWAQRNQSYIVEDDYDGEFRYQGRPIASLQGLDRGLRTLYVGTFSKVLFPSLRIGYVILPRPLIEPFVALRWLSDRQTNSHQQRVLAEFIRSGEYDRHLRRMGKRYQQRRQRLIEALQSHFSERIELQGINAGLHFLLWFRDEALAGRERDLVTQAASEGLGIYPVSSLYLDSSPPRLGLLFGYSGIEEERIEPGIRHLKALCDRLFWSGD
ncbi:MAG: PLP-dependent aminotransferase family protein [Sedimenticola sp.]|nr:PLP-dependent aminotransferase family protein [Sedimenticola sp.]